MVTGNLTEVVFCLQAAFAAGKYDQDGGVNAGSNGAGSGSARGTWGARRRNARRGRADASNARAPNGVTGGQTDAANVNDEAAEEDEEGLSVPASPSPPPPIHPCAIIIATRTFVDVHWQDGSVTHRVPSRDLVPITHGGEHDFLPGQFVSRRSEDDDAPLTPITTRHLPLTTLTKHSPMRSIWRTRWLGTVGSWTKGLSARRIWASRMTERWHGPPRSAAI